jgi:Flp pilus assembly protein TadD
VVKPDYAEARYALGTVLQQQGDLAGAIDAFRGALKHAPNAPEIHNTLGTALRQKGDMEAARVEFQEAARLNKKKSDMQAAMFAINTGLARLKEGNLDAAVERFRAAVGLAPDDAMAHYHLARALLRKGQRKAAEAEYLKAKQLDPRLKPLM